MCHILKIQIVHKNARARGNVGGISHCANCASSQVRIGNIWKWNRRDLFISKMKNMTLQGTLTFETLEPEEVLKRAIKFEHKKLTTMAFQLTNAAANVGTSTSYNSGVKIKQEPVMVVRNSSGSRRNQQYKRNSNKRPNNNRLNNSSGRAKPCNRCEKACDQGHLKNCTALVKTCKNCGKPNQFAKMCRSQQVSEIAEESERLEEECNLIRESFGSCSDFEVMSKQPQRPEAKRISKYVGDRINENNKQLVGEKVRVQKNDLLRVPTSNKEKSQKAIVRIHN